MIHFDFGGFISAKARWILGRSAGARLYSASFSSGFWASRRRLGCRKDLILKFAETLAAHGRPLIHDSYHCAKNDNHNEYQEFPHSAASCNTLARLLFNIKLRPCVSDDLVLALAWVGSFWSGSHSFCARRRMIPRRRPLHCRIIRGKSMFRPNVLRRMKSKRLAGGGLDSNSWLRFAGSSW